MQTATVMSEKRQLFLFFILAFAFTWTYWVSQLLYTRGVTAGPLPMGFSLLAGYGPALSAVIISYMAYGKSGVKNLLQRLLLWNVRYKWYAVALLLPAFISMAGTGLYLLLNGFQSLTILSSTTIYSTGELWQHIIALVFMFVLGFDGLGEEPGWRGLALPKLLNKFPVLTSSLIMGFLWAFWHLPYALTEGSAMSNQSFIKYIPGMIAASILYTWLFKNTKGSILLAILFHAAGNTWYNLLPMWFPQISSAGNYILFVQWTVVIIVLIKQGPINLSRSMQYLFLL